MKEREHVHFEYELPEGYEEAFTIDAQNKKTVIWLNVAALAVAIPLMLLAFLRLRVSAGSDHPALWHSLLFLAALLLYIVLHELAHGAAYRFLTGQKLTFGFTTTVAYCGVPNVYVYRPAAMIALLTPFVVFIPVFLIPALTFDNAWDRFYAMMLFAGHISGCVGDLYDTLLYLFRFRDNTILMRDTGPKQTFYGRT